MRSNLGRFFAAALLIAAAPASLQAEEPAHGIDPSLVIEQFDVFNDGDFLLVPVTAFGKTRMFAVDTGSSILIYDRSLRRFLKERNETVKASTHSGKMELDLYHAPLAKIGSLSLQTEAPVACTDVSELFHDAGHDVEGIIGMAFLHEHVIHLDFDSGKLLFLNATPNDAGEALRIWWRAGTPRVRVGIEGQKRKEFLIDTGYIGPACIDLPLFETLAEQKIIELLYEGWDLGATGTVETRVGRIAGISVGPFELKKVRVSGLRASNSNALGVDICRRFAITFDFPNRLAYFKPNAGFDRPFLDEIGGLTLVRKSGRTILKSVREDGPAWKGGLRRGDIVVKVDDLDATNTRLFALRQKFTSPRQTVRVKLMRGDQIIEADVKLPDEDDKDAADKPQDAGS